MIDVEVKVTDNVVMIDEQAFEGSYVTKVELPKGLKVIGRRAFANCKYLEKINTDYEMQYRFKDCKFKYTLPFDFYLPQYNCCIEFDGKQHYQIVKHFGGLDEFIDTKIRDTIKNIYCQQNNIKLIRIPYWEFDRIEEILEFEII